MDGAQRTSGKGFEALKLYSGDRLQIEIPSPQRDLRYFTSLVGHVRGLSVLVRTPVVGGLALPMRDGERLIVRGFSGTDAFSFESTVARVCLAPFPYLHLSYPERLQLTPVRREIRVKVALPVAVTRSGEDTAGHGTITNISIAGIHVDSEDEFGDKDEAVRVAFRFTIHPHGYDAHIECDAVIQSVTLQPAASGGIGFEYGLRLSGLHASEEILLQNLIYQQLLQDHHNIA